MPELEHTGWRGLFEKLTSFLPPGVIFTFSYVLEIRVEPLRAWKAAGFALLVTLPTLIGVAVAHKLPYRTVSYTRLVWLLIAVGAACVILWLGYEWLTADAPDDDYFWIYVISAASLYSLFYGFVSYATMLVLLTLVRHYTATSEPTEISGDAKAKPKSKPKPRAPGVATKNRSLPANNHQVAEPADGVTKPDEPTKAKDTEGSKAP